MRIRLSLLIIVVSLVASACSSSTTNSDASLTDDAAAVVGESVSETPAALSVAESDSDASGVSAEEPDSTNAPEPEDSTEGTVSSDDDPEETTCSAPALQGHFVDVAIEDPDGGLNLREAPGANNSILATVERGNELIPTGECEVVGSTAWWQVTNTDGSLIGWVSSRFLSDIPLLSPGLGRVMADADNVGIFAETIEGLAAQLAIIYGFGEDVTITQIGDLEGNDASSGTATYDLTGLRDDSSNGYRVDILFFIERDESGEELFGFSATRIDRQALCSRGVTDDGLCV